MAFPDDCCSTLSASWPDTKRRLYMLATKQPLEAAEYEIGKDNQQFVNLIMKLIKLMIATALSSGVAIISSGGVFAQAKLPQPTPAATPHPSGADIANKMLSPGPSDPGVPLPRPGLDDETAEARSPKSPRIYGRGEDGGLVLGLRVPIPADRYASDADAISSPGRPGSEAPQESR